MLDISSPVSLSSPNRRSGVKRTAVGIEWLESEFERIARRGRPCHRAGVMVQPTGSVPTIDEVRQRLVCLVSEIAGIPVDQITDRATVDGELQMQSVTFVELQVAIEDEYQIQIDPIRMVELNEFGAIVAYVHQCATERTE